MNTIRVKKYAAAAIPVLALAGFIEDMQTWQGVDDWVWYLVSILLTIFVGGRRLPFVLAAAFSALTLAGFELSPAGAEPGLALLNCFLGIGVLWMTAVLIYFQKRIGLERYKLSYAVEQSPVSIFITDKDGIIEYVNPKFCEVTGYTAGEATGKTPRILRSGRMSEEFYRDMWQTIKAGREWRGEFHNRRKNGELFWEQATISPVCDADGQITHFLAIKEDITDRKRTQDELRWKTAFLEAQANSTPDGVLVVNNQGRRILQNRQLFEIFKVPERIAAGEDDTELLCWVTGRIRNPEQFINRVNYLYAHPDETAHDEIVLVDGTVLDRYSAPVPSKTGGSYGRIWTFRDVTKRRQAEATVRDQAGLLDKTSDAIWTLDANERISYWNKGAELLYGWTAAEAINKSPIDLLFHGTVTPALKKTMDTVRECGEWMGEVEEFTRDGRVVTVQGRANAIYDERGARKGVLIINSNITEKKKLEAQYLRAQRMESIGTLASGIAHDLNNVLTPILMSVQILRDTVTDAEGRRLLEMMEKNVERGAGLVKQVLTFGRGLKGEQVPLQPGRVVTEVGQIIRESFPKTIKFVPHVAPDLWNITGDATQLHQVLLNLCVNARDAMPDGGVLMLEAANATLDKAACAAIPGSEPGNYIVINVVDNGTGMTREVQERIFEPFFTTKGIGKGTGLGLATSLGIIKGHGGFIQCCSEPGKGTTFSIYLPATPVTPQKSLVPNPISLPHGHGELILLVDDEPAIRVAGAEILEHFGYRVLEAADGAEAVSLFSSRPREIAAVVTDMSMPVKGGAEEITELQSINPDVKIITSSGLTEKEVAAPTSGRTHFIAKPYTADSLLNVLDDVLHEHKATAAAVAEETSFRS